MLRVLVVSISFLAAALPQVAQSKTIDFNLTGQLGETGLVANDAWDFATFSGSFTVDFDQVKTNLSTNIVYQVTAMDLTMTNAEGDTLGFEGPNEFLTGSTIDESNSLLGVFKQDAGTFSQGLSLAFYELFPSDSAGLISNRRFLQITFEAQSLVPFLEGFEELERADPLYGDASRFSSGFMQFGVGQAPTAVSSAQLTRADVAAVPLPTTVLLLLAGLGGLAGIQRFHCAST